jgi:hypothetical protein
MILFQNPESEESQTGQPACACLCHCACGPPLRTALNAAMSGGVSHAVSAIWPYEAA